MHADGSVLQEMPLHGAVRSGNVAMVRALVRHIRDVMFLAREEELEEGEGEALAEIVRGMLSAHNARGQTALQVAQESGESEMEALLLALAQGGRGLSDEEEEEEEMW